MKHGELAGRVMEMLLDGEEEVLSALREQYAGARIVSVEDSGAGFYIRFRTDKAMRIGEGFRSTFQVGDVDGEVNGMDGAVGFVLFIKGGCLAMLEGYTCGIDKWPDTDADIKLSYNTVFRQRDYASLRKTWTN